MSLRAATPTSSLLYYVLRDLGTFIWCLESHSFFVATREVDGWRYLRKDWMDKYAKGSAGGWDRWWDGWKGWMKLRISKTQAQKDWGSEGTFKSTFLYHQIVFCVFVEGWMDSMAFLMAGWFSWMEWMDCATSLLLSYMDTIVL